MQISGSTSAAAATYVQPLKPADPIRAVQGGGDGNDRENDGDKDDAVSANSSANVTPTRGQKVNILV